jgi:hypothetical protein
VVADLDEGGGRHGEAVAEVERGILDTTAKIRSISSGIIGSGALGVLTLDHRGAMPPVMRSKRVVPCSRICGCPRCVRPRLWTGTAASHGANGRRPIAR